MNNPSTYKALSVLGFIVSALFTVKLFASNSTDMFSLFAMVSTALLYEFGKYTLLYQALKGPFKSTVRSFMLGAWVFVTCASIVASATYVLNDANENKNIQVENSAEFHKQQDSIAIKKDLYSTKKQEIDNLRKLQEQTAQKGEEIKNSMPRNYIDRRQQQQDKTNKDVSSIQEQINAKSSELSQIAQDLSTPIGEIKIETESTTGGSSMFKLIAEKLNKNPKNKKNPYTTEEVGIFFYIAIGVGLELLANLFAFLSQYYQNMSVSPTPSNTDPEKKPVPILETNHNIINTKEIQGGRLTGLKFKVKAKNKITGRKSSELPPVIKLVPKVSSTPPTQFVGFTNKDLEKYINYMFDNTTTTKNGIESPGITSISKSNIDLSYKTCRAIHGYLSTLGAIQTKGKSTIILKSKSELLCTVKQAI